MSGLSGWLRSTRGDLVAFVVVAMLTVLSAATQAQHTRPQEKLKDSECLACHGDRTLTSDEGGRQVSLYVDGDRLKHSFHSRLFNCVDCHTDVKSLAHDTPPRKIGCAQCHAEAQQAWQRTLHARASKAGNGPAASCQDCHGGAHQILTPGDPQSPVFRANIPATCGRCHGQKFLMEQNGESAQAFLSYQDSVHGRAVESGSP